MNIIILINRLYGMLSRWVPFKIKLLLWVESTKTHTKCSVDLGTSARKGDVLGSLSQYEILSSVNVGALEDRLILGINTMYMLFCFFKLFLVGLSPRLPLVSHTKHYTYTH